MGLIEILWGQHWDSTTHPCQSHIIDQILKDWRLRYENVKVKQKATA